MKRYFDLFQIFVNSPELLTKLSNVYTNKHCMHYSENLREDQEKKNLISDFQKIEKKLHHFHTMEISKLIWSSV